MSKKDEYVIITTHSDGFVGVDKFGKNKKAAELCYELFFGDTITLYKIFIKDGEDILLSPIKTRKEEKSCLNETNA